ncbi:MAG TPA: methyltransferase [Geminicoccaceae bacterium]
MPDKEIAIPIRPTRRPGAPPEHASCWSSPLDAARAFGLTGDRFYKIVDQREVGGRRRQDLRGEFDLLRRCRGLAGVPEALELIEADGKQILVLERVPGRPLSRLEPSWLRFVLIELGLLGLVWGLARRGVRHNDLRPENILVASDGRIHLVDFDQASTGSLVECVLAGLGLPVGRAPVCNGLLAPVRERIQARLSPRLIRALRGRRLRDAPMTSLPSLPAGAGASARALHEAWHIAADATASAPGRQIAYYELEWEGVRLPGERPWTARWSVLRHLTPYANRRVLELGCNMALLSTFLLKDAGAAAALAVDRDPAILAAAARVAKAFGVQPQFRQIDFDRDREWEDQLEAFRPDVVVALSVLHWVQDKARFMAFLGRFNEVIFEGHDSSRTERQRLLRAGFTEIDLVDTSERGRPLLLARKG